MDEFTQKVNEIEIYGFTIVENVLTADEVAEMREAMQEPMEAVDDLKRAADPFNPNPGPVRPAQPQPTEPTERIENPEPMDVIEDRTVMASASHVERG